LFTVAIIIIIALIALLHTPVDHQMRSWKLLPEPEKLTELYFTHPNNLPTKYMPGQQQAVSFTVHNLEYQTTGYQYKIIETSQAGDQAVTLASGSFSLQQNQYKSPTVSITTADLGQNVKVEVELVNQHESIDYLLERTGA
jgi:uncharacterized membrane protein